jgi:hypothetical protein
MKNIDLTYIIPTILSIISFIVVLFYGKSKVQKDSHIRILRYIPILSVFGLIIGVFVITNYYSNQLAIEKEKFNKLEHQSFYSDSILLNSKLKNKSLDSLKLLKKELDNILKNINKQENIIGESSNIKDKLKVKISSTNEEIGKIESYNEIIEAPTFISKGYISSGNTSNFQVFCPTDTISEYLDIKLKFIDIKIIEKISCIYIEILEIKQDRRYELIFSQTYIPKDGVNAFKIRNYFKNKNVNLSVGYFLKSEIEKEYPRYEKVTFRFK